MSAQEKFEKIFVQEVIMIFNRDEVRRVGSEEEIKLQGQSVDCLDESDSQDTRTRSFSLQFTPFQPFSDVEEVEAELDGYTYSHNYCHQVI